MPSIVVMMTKLTMIAAVNIRTLGRAITSSTTLISGEIKAIMMMTVFLLSGIISLKQYLMKRTQKGVVKISKEHLTTIYSSGDFQRRNEDNIELSTGVAKNIMTAFALFFSSA